MENSTSKPEPNASSIRWQILRHALRRREILPPGGQAQVGMERISRKSAHGFNLIPLHIHSEEDMEMNKLDNRRDVSVCYTLPIQSALKLHLLQRVDIGANLRDFEICNRYNIDNTGLVCHWPSEDVLAYFCLSHDHMFRSKRVIELGSGYGLAGLVIAAATDALEVVISDGNPQVVDYIRHNIDANAGNFGSTEVKAMILHWSSATSSNIYDTFDVIIASDCTFFKESHKDLVQTVKLLLKKDGRAEAVFFSPRRGDSLEKFLEEAREGGLQLCLTENYDNEVWTRHQSYMEGDDFWPSYEKDHCYPLFLRINL